MEPTVAKIRLVSVVKADGRLESNSSRVVKVSVLVLLVVLTLPILALAAQQHTPQSPHATAPLEMAGFRLGESIKAYEGLTDPGKTEEELAQLYLTTTMLKPMAGYRSGYVTYGNCRVPGRILRVKMNYQDQSLKFYDKLLVALKKRYGEPQQWRGNPFGTLRIWKWGLRDPNLGDISIVLQHYSGDDDTFTKGNSIRLAAPELTEQEKACYLEKHPPTQSQTPPVATFRELGLDYFLPR